MKRPVRIVLLAAVAVVLLVAGTGAVLVARFDPNAYKPQIIEAVKHATGRELTLNGKISLKASLWPTIQVADVGFANPPGFSRPRMATLQGLELQLALLPLLSSRFEIDRLVLLQPDILLESDAGGHSNWQLAPEVSPSAPAGTQAPVRSGGTTTAVSVGSIQIKDGSLAYRDDATGKVTTLGLPTFAAVAASPDSPLRIEADASYNGTRFGLVGDTGSLSRLQDPAATTPWPVKLVLTAVGARLAADGSLSQPLQGKGYALAVSGSVPEVAALAPLLPGVPLPPLREVSFAGRIADVGGKMPAVSALALHAGASDLGARLPGLTLDKLDIAAVAADQPVKVDAVGNLAGQGWNLAATIGPLGLLVQGSAPGPFGVDIGMHVVGATIAAKGSIADARAMTGANILLVAQIPDLLALSPLARRPLPPVKQVAFQGTVTDVPGGLRGGAILHSFTLTSAAGDLSGDVALAVAARPDLVAVVKSNRVDLDALLGALGQGAAAALPTGPAAAEASRPGGQPPPEPRRNERLFSEQPFPVASLRSADADLKLTVADLRSGGADYRALATHVVLKGGKLTVDPYAADLPEGHMAGSLTVDASQGAPPVHIKLHAPGLALQSILAALQEPSFARGNMELYADLRGAGASPHAVAASLDGSVGIAVAGGTIDNRLLGSVLGKVLDSLNALDLVGKGGNSDLRCFGVRMEAQHGVGSIKTLALSSSLLTMTGGGAVNLSDETLALQLRPHARIGATAWSSRSISRGRSAVRR